MSDNKEKYPIKEEVIEPVFAEYLDMNDPIEILQYAEELLTPVIQKELNDNGFKTEGFRRLFAVEQALLKAIYKLDSLVA